MKTAECLSTPASRGFNLVFVAFLAIALLLGSRHTPAANYSDIWWNPNESGWGLTIADHETQLFIVWYTYRQDRRPIWYVLPGGTFSSDRRFFQGNLYVTTGPSYNSMVFDPNRVTRSLVGSAVFDFMPAGMVDGTVLFTYTMGGVTQTKQVQRQPFGNAAPSWGSDFTDIYYNPAESGWGLTLAQHGNNIFGVWYTYDTDGEPLWFVLPGITFNGTSSFSGALYRTTGPYFAALPFNPNVVTRTLAGTATVTFPTTAAAAAADGAKFLTRPSLRKADALCYGTSAAFQPFFSGFTRPMLACVQPFGKQPIHPSPFEPRECSGLLSATVTGYWIQVNSTGEMIRHSLDQPLATRIVISGIDWTKPGEQTATIVADRGRWLPGGDYTDYFAEIPVTMGFDAIGTMVGSGVDRESASEGQVFVEMTDEIDFRVPGGLNVTGHLAQHLAGGGNGITLIDYQWRGSFSCIPDR